MIRALTNGVTISTSLKKTEDNELRPLIILQSGETKHFLNEYEINNLENFIIQFKENIQKAREEGIS